jgi:DNA-binding NarL/FixJ family response regulator
MVPFRMRKGVPVRSVLVCLRTTMAAHAVATAAAQLGLTEVISTAVGAAATLTRVSEAPVDLLLVDTASVRPEAVTFTRHVRERLPEAVIVFFGAEDPATAQAAVAAGARGVIRGGDHEDLASSVAKALMLLMRPARPAAVPLQRSEPEEGEEPEADAEADATSPGAAATPAGVSLSNVRRLALTERELQVLRGMADGKSNAEIGRELFVSEDTVKTHARRLFRKLGARDRAHAVAAAFRAGLVS